MLWSKCAAIFWKTFPSCLSWTNPFEAIHPKTDDCAFGPPEKSLKIIITLLQMKIIIYNTYLIIDIYFCFLRVSLTTCLAYWYSMVIMLNYVRPFDSFLATATGFPDSKTLPSEPKSRSKPPPLIHITQTGLPLLIPSLSSSTDLTAIPHFNDRCPSREILRSSQYSDADFVLDLSLKKPHLPRGEEHNRSLEIERNHIRPQHEREPCQISNEKPCITLKNIKTTSAHNSSPRISETRPVQHSPAHRKATVSGYGGNCDSRTCILEKYSEIPVQRHNPVNSQVTIASRNNQSYHDSDQVYCNQYVDVCDGLDSSCVTDWKLPPAHSNFQCQFPQSRHAEAAIRGKRSMSNDFPEHGAAIEVTRPCSSSLPCSPFSTSPTTCSPTHSSSAYHALWHTDHRVPCHWLPGDLCATTHLHRECPASSDAAWSQSPPQKVTFKKDLLKRYRKSGVWKGDQLVGWNCRGGELFPSV